MLGPNIQGGLGFLPSNSSGDNRKWNGCLSWSRYGNTGGVSTAGSTAMYDVNFDASKSNSTYGASTTVQPKSLNINILIKY